jgi:tungstate transport system substrate-binding protein
VGRLAACACAMTALVGTTAITSSSTAQGVTKTNVIVQGGTTPIDSGLYQNVIFPKFTAQYPQYNLQYVSVGTGQAITNAEAGQGDAVFTHSPTLENTFVTSGYSYEAGGRLVMASDFVAVGPTSDPAGVITAGNHDAVNGFKAIATAGNAGTADFVSRGDASGTNKEEEAIWKLTGIPVDSAGEPTDPNNSSQLAPWYHKTGVGQAQNLQITNQCPFSSGNCYTIADSGTFNYQLSLGNTPALEIVSQYNDGPNAVGGTSLLLNPYHVYAVNPAKIPSAHINLPGAIAFLNFMTDPATQAAIAAYPNASAPAFLPDARPDVAITQNLPHSAIANQTLTVTGTVKPNYSLDPSIAGAPVFVERRKAPGVVIGSGTLQSNGSFSISFLPPATDYYTIFVPAFPDGLVQPSNTAYRQSTAASLTKVTVKAYVTLQVDGTSGLTANVSGTALPSSGRKAAKVYVQYKNGTSWVNLVAPIAMMNGPSTWSASGALPHAGTWKLRARYVDSGVVSTATTAQVPVSVS